MNQLTMKEIKFLNEKAKNIRIDILKSITKANSGHTGGSLSIADLLTLLFFHEMNINPANPKMENRDRLVISKGHGAPALYAALAEKGYFPKEEMDFLRQINHMLQGHPDMKHTPGVDMTTGSLGQGFSAACGMALAAKMDHADWRVYTILGDGELEEGQIWEAAMYAAHYKLDHLTAFIDNNGLQIDGAITDVMSSLPIDKKFSAFGWHVITVNGHNMAELHNAIEEARNIKGKPTMIIMKTVKGKGIPEIEGKASWHGKAPSSEECERENAGGGIMGKATRDAYGETLKRLGSTHPDIVVLDADLSESTKTSIFAKKFPDRFFDTGIAEENMIGIAAGLATTGKIPFASTFAVFGAGRAYEQIRNSICYPNLNVKIAVTHAGLTVGEDGATHQMLEDIALMRALPNMTVIVPADAAETEAAVRWAADYNGPVYIRMGRAKCDDIMDPKVIFSPGKSVVLKDGHDVAIVACGIMVSKALRAAESLEGKGVSARVINLSSIKPIDVKTIIKAAKDTGAILTCEEHTIMGGLGSAVAEVVCKNNPVPMGMVGTEDTFGESGKAEDLLEKYGLTVKHIEEEAIRLLERK